MPVERAEDDTGPTRVGQADDRNLPPLRRAAMAALTPAAETTGRPWEGVKLLAAALGLEGPAAGRPAGAGRGDIKAPRAGAMARPIATPLGRAPPHKRPRACARAGAGRVAVDPFIDYCFAFPSY